MLLGHKARVRVKIPRSGQVRVNHSKKVRNGKRIGGPH